MRLTFNLQGQHEVLADALKDPLLREQGFLPRFILTVPENLAGQRTQDNAFRDKTKHTNKDPRLTAYWQRCDELLPLFDYERNSQQIDSDTPTRPIIPMNDEAEAIDLYFYNECERLQAKGKQYEYFQPFASRAPQLARRLATVMAYFDKKGVITGDTMQSACEVLRHSLREWSRYAEVETLAESNAQKLASWIAKRCIAENTNTLLYSMVQSSCPRPTRNNRQLLEPTLTELEDTNYIRITTLGDKRYIELSPFYKEKVQKGG